MKINTFAWIVTKNSTFEKKKILNKSNRIIKDENQYLSLPVLWQKFQQIQRNMSIHTDENPHPYQNCGKRFDK